VARDKAKTHPTGLATTFTTKGDQIKLNKRQQKNKMKEETKKESNEKAEKTVFYQAILSAFHAEKLDIRQKQQKNNKIWKLIM